MKNKVWIDKHGNEYFVAECQCGVAQKYTSYVRWADNGKIWAYSFVGSDSMSKMEAQSALDTYAQLRRWTLKETTLCQV